MYAKPPAASAGRDAALADMKRPSGVASVEDGMKKAFDKKPLDWGTAGERASIRSSEVAGADATWASQSVVGEERGVVKEGTLAEDRGKTAASPPASGFVQDPFLHGVNCYAEVFMEIPDTTLSGIVIDPKAVTVYPTTRIYGGVSVQKEVLTGKYVIWNMAGEVRGSHSELEFDQPRSSTRMV